MRAAIHGLHGRYMGDALAKLKRKADYLGLKNVRAFR
jgi:hypothetical protein